MNDAIWQLGLAVLTVVAVAYGALTSPRRPGPCIGKRCGS